MTDQAFRLLRRHQQLDEQLRRERTRRWVDPFRIARIRKLKLAVKDRLMRLSLKPSAV
ncbi:MAG: YdcH family protein [Sphingomonadales bacterium]|nr:YdcH family protein [Sphingomonadales bacterium]